MLSRNVTTALLAWMFGCGAMFGAQAQQPISAGQQGGNPSGWTFNVAPYLWMATINSTANFDLPRPANGTVTAESSIGFGGLLSHLNFATMVAADARYGRFSLVTDFIYLNLGGTASQLRTVHFQGRLPIPISATAQASESLNLNAKVWTLAGGFTLLQGDWGNFDVIAGFRYLGMPMRMNFDLGLTVTGPAGGSEMLGRVGNLSGTANLWNGIGGFRGRIHLGDTGLFIPYYFDAGAGSSKLTWQISSGLGYHVGSTDVSLTYRYLSWEQGDNAVLQHMQVKGPLLMANFTF